MNYYVSILSLILYACGGTYPGSPVGPVPTQAADCVTQFRLDEAEKFNKTWGSVILGPTASCPLIKGSFGPVEAQQAYQLDCANMDITGKPTSESYTIYTNWDGVTEVYQSNSVTWQITGPNVPACVTALNKAYPSPAFNLLTDCKIGTPWNHCKL